MQNSSEIVSFVLAAYLNMGKLKYVYFGIILSWYFSIFVANTVLIVVIYFDRKLHEPMYILLCNLFVNEISGSSSLFPLMLSQMFSDNHEVTLPCCFLQMCYMYTSASVEFCTLTAMAYDRYVCICHPLHYNSIMSTERVFMIIAFAWMYSLLSSVVSFSFIMSLKFCGNLIDKVFCDHYFLIKLACSVSAQSFSAEIVFVFVAIAIPFSLISASYMKILAVCFNSSKEKHKAVATCMPQIVSVSNLFVGCIFHFIDSRYKGHQVPGSVRIFLSVYLLVCQPMITPFMYGFNLPKIRHSCKRLLFEGK